MKVVMYVYPTKDLPYVCLEREFDLWDLMDQGVVTFKDFLTLISGETVRLSLPVDVCNECDKSSAEE